MKVFVKVKISEMILIFILIFVTIVELKPTPSPQFPFTVLTTRDPNRPHRPDSQGPGCKVLIHYFITKLIAFFVVFYDFVSTIACSIKKLFGYGTSLSYSYPIYQPDIISSPYFEGPLPFHEFH